MFILGNWVQIFSFPFSLDQGSDEPAFSSLGLSVLVDAHFPPLASPDQSPPCARAKPMQQRGLGFHRRGGPAPPRASKAIRHARMACPTASCSLLRSWGLGCLIAECFSVLNTSLNRTLVVQGSAFVANWRWRARAQKFQGQVFKG